MAKATTLGAYLNQMQWYFYEKGMQRIWNELARLASTDNNAALTSPAHIGTLAFTTNCDPDYVPKIADPAEGRTGAGGTTYPSAAYPPLGCGFVPIVLA